jgi:signal transduction histidine kinase
LKKQAEDTLWDLIGSVTGTLDLEQVLTLTMENAARVTDAVASTLFLHDPETGDLVFSVPTGPAAEELKDVRLPHGQGIAGWVAVHKTSLIVPDVQKDSRFFSAIDEDTGFVTRSVLAVPLMNGDELLGVLETINKKDGASFTEEDALLLTVFSEQATTALVNARVHAALKNQLEEIRQSRDRIIEAEKYRALQTLASGLSHDFNNLLNAIIGFAELVAMDVADEAVKKDVAQIIKAGRRAMELVEHIHGLGGPHKRENTLLDCNSLVSRVVKQFRLSLPESIQIRLTLAETDARISGDPALLQMALEKILTNAMEAIGDRTGIITVDAEVVPELESNQENAVGMAHGQYFRINITDDGAGIADDVIRMVFDPYFTTKRGGIGKGLGLHSAQGIIQGHDGDITLSSEIEQGTCVQVTLPIAIDAPGAAYPSVDRLPRGYERVLIVDDESFVSITLEKMLTYLGYQVTRVDSSQKALDHYDNELTRPDAVITDWALPDIPGDALAEKLVSKYTGARIILMTAFSGDFDEAALRTRGVRALLPKPVDIQVLADALRRVLEE